VGRERFSSVGSPPRGATDRGGRAGGQALVPETRGLSLEEIEAKMRNGSNGNGSNGDKIEDK
jgi:hypothetical protein